MYSHHNSIRVGESLILILRHRSVPAMKNKTGLAVEKGTTENVRSFQNSSSNFRVKLSGQRAGGRSCDAAYAPVADNFTE